MYKTFRKSIALLLTMLMIFNVSAIAAGTTDGVGVKLYWSDDISSSVWNDAENADTNAIFAVDGFEAGSEAVRYLKVQSTGSLAYSYVLDAVYGGADASLAEAIDVYVKEGVTANVAISDMTRMGTLADVFSGAKLSEGKISPASEAATDGYYYTENIIAVALKMSETVGAEYMNKILDSFDITLSATECDFEYARGEFSVKFPNTDKYLYRVGNQNTVAVGSLFEGANVVGDVKVTVTPLDAEHPASGTYTANSSDWTKGTIQFGGTGIVEVTITDSSASTQPVSLKLEVVDAKNATTHTSATANNVVLLNDISGGFSISNGYAVYGNGFTITCSGNGAYRGTTGMKIGFINIDEGGILDSARVICDVFPISPIYTAELEDFETTTSNGQTIERYKYQLSAISISGNSTVSNCYIYGARNNVFVGGGNVTIKDTILESGSLSNVHIKSNSDYNVTLDNLTTVQYPTTSKYDTEKTVMGFGVIVGDNESTSNAAITLKGDLRQYNWVNGDMSLSSDFANQAIEGALKVGDYQYTIDGKTSVNMGIVYLNSLPETITDTDERSNKAEIPYARKSISISGQDGTVYSVLSGSSLAASRYDAKADGVVPAEISETDYYKPQFKLKSDLGGQYIANTEGCDRYCYEEDGTIKVMVVSGDYMELDLAAAASINKYTNQNLGVVITCKDVNGNSVEVSDGKVTLSQIMDYTVTYTVTDSVFYDKDGQKIEKTTGYSWNVPVSVTLKDKNIPNARFDIDSTKHTIYADSTKIFGTGDYKQYMPPLAGLKIYDYIGQTEYLRFDGDNDFSKIAKASINNVNTTGQAQGYHIVTIELVDGGKIIIDLDVRATSGGSTHTGSLRVSNNVLYVVNGGTTSAKGQLWKVYSYKFIGNNGVEIDSGAVTFGTDGVDATTGTAPDSSFSTTVSATVTYDANGGICGQTVGYKTNLHSALTLPTPTRSGYVFAGWYTALDGGTSVGRAGDSYTPSGDITLYAMWDVPSKVTYNANGGVCDVKSDTYTGTGLILPTATRDGYWLTGWYTEATGGTKVGNAGGSYFPSTAITLYAQWSPVYNVSFNANGGSVSTASVSYTGTPIVLPAASNGDKALAGWYTAASGGTKIGNAGDNYVPTSDITIYAQWKESVAVTYNANGGTCDTSSQTYYGNPLVLPAATRSGYKLIGWYTAASGGTKIGDARASYTPAENITLYAQWSGCVVTYDANGGSCSTASQTYAGVALTLPTPTRNNYTFNGWYTAASGGTKVGDAGASYTPTSDITLYAQWTSSSSGPCVTPDTLITLADGTQKRIDQIAYDDQLLVWNFFEGKYDVASSAIIFKHSYSYSSIIELKFEDDTDVKIITLHQFFDATENRFATITEENVADFVGHKFAKADGDSYKFVELVDYEITHEYITPYGIISAVHYNIITNEMISTDFMIEDYNMFNYFEVGEGMKFDSEKMQADIDKYGLYTYEDFSDYLTYEEFAGFNAQYLKIPVGKGYYTFEDILDRIEYWGLGYSDNNHPDVVNPDNSVVALIDDMDMEADVTITSSGNTIASATYGITVTVNGNATENNTFVCDSDECVFTIAATGSASYRYAEIKIADNTYYTQALATDGTTTFTAKNANGQTISFVPVYGTHQNDVTDGITFYSVEIQVQNATPSGDAYVCDTDEAVFGFTAAGVGGTGYGIITIDGKDFYTSQIAPGETATIVVKNASGKTVTVATANGTHENDATTEINYYSVEATTENMTATENGYVCGTNEATITFAASGIADGYVAITVDGDVYYAIVKADSEAKVTVKNAKGKELTYEVFAGECENESTTLIDLGTVGYTVDGTSVTISNTTKYEAEGYDVYVAVYSGNKLLGVQFDSVEKLAAKDSKTFAPEIDTPDNSTVKVFIWKYKTLIPYFN